MSDTGLPAMGKLMRESYQRAVDQFAKSVHEFVLAQHRPVEAEPGVLVCMNHWTDRPRPWPCEEYQREQDRWAARG